MDDRSRWDGLLLYGVLPAWIAAGIADWWCHRRSAIDRHASTHESILHLAMGAQAGATLLATLFLEPIPAVAAFAIGGALVHEATVVYDVAYTAPRRTITQAENHVHSALEILPFVVASVATATARRAAPGFRFPALPGGAVVAGIAAAAILGMGPHLEEFVRCLRARPTLAPQPIDGSSARP